MATCVDGHEVPDEYRFCVHCGKPMPRRCPNGHDVPEAFAFCGHCGEPMGAVPDAPAEACPTKAAGGAKAAKKKPATKQSGTKAAKKKPATKQSDTKAASKKKASTKERPPVEEELQDVDEPPDPREDEDTAAEEEVPPGWYPSPDDPGLERWWDGGTWTGSTRPRGTAQGGGGFGRVLSGAGQAQPTGPGPDREAVRDALLTYLEPDPPVELAFKAAFSQGQPDTHLKPIGLVALFPGYLVTLTIEAQGSTGQVFGRRFVSAFKPSGGVHSVIEGLADPVSGLLTVAQKILGDRVDEDVLWTALNNPATAIVPTGEIRRVTTKRKYAVPRFWIEHDHGLLIIAQQSDEEMRHGLDLGPAFRQLSGKPWRPDLLARLQQHAQANATRPTG